MIRNLFVYYTKLRVLVMDYKGHMRIWVPQIEHHYSITFCNNFSRKFTHILQWKSWTEFWGIIKFLNKGHLCDWSLHDPNIQIVHTKRIKHHWTNVSNKEYVESLSQLTWWVYRFISIVLPYGNLLRSEPFRNLSIIWFYIIDT